MKIFIGLAEVANTTWNYIKAFQTLGHQTYSVVWNRNPFYPEAIYDVVLSDIVPNSPQPGNNDWKKVCKARVLAALNLVKASDCDVFLFAYGSSFLPAYLDYALLKGLGKRLVSVFWGSDIRFWYAFEQEMSQMGVAEEVQPFTAFSRSQRVSYFRLQRRVAAAERYADLILSQPGFGQLQRRPYMRANIPIDLSQFRAEVPDRAVPLVIHAPSRRDTKGTHYVLAAVEQLKAEGVPFEFRLIENMPNVEVRQLLTDTDIVVDELYSETIGMLSTEAMASGCVTLTRYFAEYAGVASGCPAINVNNVTLAEELRRVIVDRDIRRRLAEAGRPYVAAHHDHVKVAQQILDWLQPGGIPQYDFTPTFYQQLQVPPEVLAEERRKGRWWDLFIT
ncbi:MAG: glycosyltransferase family 4 protein [Chloroflexi bacterium]|nr:glycosyltransferase family 4 protein [Chloroflexota bacterium]